MSKTVVKHNKKEEQKKLAVRIICMVLVVALVVTSLLAMFPTLFQTVDPELQEMIDAGYVYQAEDGNYYYTDEYIDMLTAMLSEAEVTTTEGEESHEGHDHEGHDHE